MTLPIFIIHDLSHAIAVANVVKRSERSVFIKSAPGLATTLGPEGYLAILDEIKDLCGRGSITGVLDCGAEPGVALGALRRGVKFISVDLSDTIQAKISEIAEQHGATIFVQLGTALDLIDQADMDSVIHQHILDGTL